MRAAQQHANDAEASQEPRLQYIEAVTAAQNQVKEQVQLIPHLKSQLKDAQQQHTGKAQQLQQSQMKQAAAEAARMQHACHLAAVEQQLCNEALVVAGQTTQLQQLHAELSTSRAQTQQDAACIADLRIQLTGCQTQRQQDGACIAALNTQLTASAEVSWTQLEQLQHSYTQLADTQAESQQDAACIAALRRQLADATLNSATQLEQLQQCKAQLGSVNLQEHKSEGQLDGANQQLVHETTDFDQVRQQLQHSKGQVDSLQHSSAKRSGDSQQLDPARADAQAQKVGSEGPTPQLKKALTLGSKDADKLSPAFEKQPLLLCKQQIVQRRQTEERDDQNCSKDNQAKNVAFLQQELPERSRTCEDRSRWLAVRQTCAAHLTHVPARGQSAAKQDVELYSQVGDCNTAHPDLV